MLILKWGYFWPWGNEFISCCSVSQLCLILCDLMCCSMPSFPDLHFLPEFALTNLHWVNDAIQTSHPLPPSPPALSLLRAFSNKLAFASGGQSIEASAPDLPMNTQVWFPLGLTGSISLLSKGLSRAFSSTTVPNINVLALSFLYVPTLTLVHDYWKKHSSEYVWWKTFDVSAV